MEALSTVLAGVGPRVRMDQEVGGQGGRALESLSTHLAFKASLLLGEMRTQIIRISIYRKMLEHEDSP